MDMQQPEHGEEQREAARQRREILERTDFKTVIETPEGRRFMRRVLGECGVHRSSFCGEPLTMAYTEGRRAMGLWLQGLFADFPDQYIQLLTEETKE